MASHKINGLRAVFEMKEKAQVLTATTENQAPPEMTAGRMLSADQEV